MRILHTIGRMEADASDAEILSAAQWQAAQGFHVVLSTPRDAAIAETAREAGLKVEPAELESRFNGRGESLLRGPVRRHGIQILHAHDAEAGFLGLVCVDMCPVVRSLSKDEVAALVEAPEAGLPFDHVIVATAALRDRLVKAELIAREHVTVLGAGEARMQKTLEAYERAVVRALTGRLIPARFVGGAPELPGRASLAAE